MPRALTEQERCAQCQRLLEKGKSAVMLYGVRKVSVDDIAKAAGMAKGTFYQHFNSKEEYLFALVEKIHHEAFAQARQMLFGENADESGAQDALVREKVRAFLPKLFALPEMLFFIQNEREITALMETAPGGDTQSFKQLEEQLFAELLNAAGIDTAKIKPGVVHNFVHTLFIVQSSDMMAKKDLQETLDLLMDCLLSYLFGGES